MPLFMSPFDVCDFWGLTLQIANSRAGPDHLRALYSVSWFQWRCELRVPKNREFIFLRLHGITVSISRRAPSAITRTTSSWRNAAHPKNKYLSKAPEAWQKDIANLFRRFTTAPRRLGILKNKEKHQFLTPVFV